MAHIQTVIGSMTGASAANCAATGSAISAGSFIVGAIVYYAPSGQGYVLSYIQDDQNTTYTPRDTIYYADVYLISFTGIAGNAGPIRITAGFEASPPIGYAQIGWSEYSGLDRVNGSGGQTQTTPGTGADAITTSPISLTSSIGTFWAADINYDASITTAAGTGFTPLAHDLTPGWGFIVEEKAITGSTAQGTFTDATSGGSTTYYTLGVGLSRELPFSSYRRRPRQAKPRKKVFIGAKETLPFPIIRPATVISYKRLQARKHWLLPRKRRLRPRSIQLRPLVYPFPAVARPLSYNQGIAFRATGTFVTDVAFFDYSAGGGYPQTTKQGNIVGFTQTYPTVVAQNELATQDARLAGNLYNNF